jgi:hypothetical protein
MQESPAADREVDRENRPKLFSMAIRRIARLICVSDGGQLHAHPFASEAPVSVGYKWNSS